jgi:hypothetical protein
MKRDLMALKSKGGRGISPKVSGKNGCRRFAKKDVIEPYHAGGDND